MRVLHENARITQETAVAIGFFDGIHIGHAALLQDIKCRAPLVPTVYTFDSKPAHRFDKSIFTPDERLCILEALGIEIVYVQPFTKAFSHLTKEAFLSRFVRDLNAKHITVGFDFHFGENASGDDRYLARNTGKYGYSLTVVPEIDCALGKISSTLIRSELTKGDVSSAARLMGHFYFIDGKVEKGTHLGTRIGIPTANISTGKLLPKFGVYATIAQIDGNAYPAVTNVGVKPTVTDKRIPNAETFIFDFSGDVYNEDIRVNFVEFMRPERTFESVDALRAEILKNISDAKIILRPLDVYKPFLLW